MTHDSKTLAELVALLRKRAPHQANEKPFLADLMEQSADAIEHLGAEVERLRDGVGYTVGYAEGYESGADDLHKWMRRHDAAEARATAAEKDRDNALAISQGQARRAKEAEDALAALQEGSAT